MGDLLEPREGEVLVRVDDVLVVVVGGLGLALVDENQTERALDDVTALEQLRRHAARSVRHVVPDVD